MPISPDQLFAEELEPVRRAERFEELKAALRAETHDSLTGRTQLTAGAGISGDRQIAGPEGGRIITKSAAPGAVLDGFSPDILKAVDPGVLESFRSSLEQAMTSRTEMLTKDFTLTSPLSTGFVPFDLEAPSKKLTPKPTPLRNRIARLPGQGTARRYKRLLGFSGTGTGGVADIWPGITDSTTTAFGSLSYIRGPKISYASDEKTINYKQFSLSDAVTWSAQYSGQGYEDIRQLSQTSVLWASMLAEEKMILGGRGTDGVFIGALAAPTAITLTARAAAPGEVGLTAGRYWVKVTTQAQFGESVLSASVNVDNVTAGQVVDITATLPGGALGMKVYAAQVAAAGADPGDAVKYYQGRTGYKTFSLGAASNVIITGSPASGITADTTAFATGYDGILAYLGDSAQSGYVARLDAPFSSSNPGAEYQTAFASLYNSVKADPDEILFNGSDRKQLSDLLKTASSSNYRLTIQQSEIGGVVLGDIVTAVQNEVTGKVVQMSVHPWLIQGNTPIISWSLPIPDTQVSNVFEFHGPQDYMGVQWPVTQFLYEMSSYWYNALVCYAPAWGGMLQGLKQV